MSTILQDIVANKRKEIAQLKPLTSIARFEKEGIFWDTATRSLRTSLLAGGSTGIIAEFKRKSPSRGWFQPKEVKVESVVRSYDTDGAAGISVLTDNKYFGGGLEDLVQAKQLTEVPVLRKDFIVDEWQVAESRAYGADVILLIAACLSPAEVKQLAGFARSLGLESLLEIHHEEELVHICDEVDMIGINNRNLKTFEVDINTSLQLVDRLPAGKPAIAESGISDAAAIVSLRNAGFKGFLVGETFMKEADPGRAFRDFVKELRSLV
jgi:indole-3-glycerol phosphate synthase